MANSNLPFSRDAYDDLADLFLTEPAAGSQPAHPIGDAPLPFPRRTADEASEPRPTGPTAPCPPRLVAIVRVNLPIIAGPWLEQAAAAVASQDGPVVLIRERNGKVCLDLVAGRDDQRDVAAALAATPVESLPAAVERLNQIIGCWVVETPSSEDARPRGLEGLDEIVLLTGADEAATVAAFAQAKSIVASTRRRPALSLIVVGSEEETARRSAERIAHACEKSLKCAISLRAVVRRMQPVPMRHLGRFTQAGELTSAIADALSRPAQRLSATPEVPLETDSSRAARPADATIPRVVLRPRTAPPATIEATDLPPRPNPRRAPGTESLPTVPTPTADEERLPAMHREPVRDGVQTAPPIHPPLAKPPPGIESPGTLLSLLGDLQPLEMACPRAPGVELGFDLHGRLHTLAEDDSADALQRLVVASDWAREHGELLTRLNPWLASAARVAGGAVDVTAHLFTSRPRDRRHLADGALRIHILIRDAASPGRIVAHLDLN